MEGKEPVTSPVMGNVEGATRPREQASAADVANLLQQLDQTKVAEPTPAPPARLLTPEDIAAAEALEEEEQKKQSAAAAQPYPGYKIPPAPPRPVPIPPAASSASLPPIINYPPVQLNPIPPQPMPGVGSKEWVKQSINNFSHDLRETIDKVANKLKRQPAAARRQALDSGQQLNEILTSWGETLLEREKRRQTQPATGAMRAGQVAGDILLGATAFGISGAGKEAAKILLGPSGLAIAAIGGGLQSAVRGVGELTRNGGLETAMQRKDVKGLNLFGRYADVETWGARGAVRIFDILQRRSDSPAEKQDRDELLAIIHGSGAEFSTFVGPDRDFNPDNFIKALDFIDHQQLTPDEKSQTKARLSAQAVRTLGRSSQIGYADIDSSKAAELDKFLTEALTNSATFVEQFQKGTVEQKQQANELIAIMAESRRSKKNLFALNAFYLGTRTLIGMGKAVAVFEIAQGAMELFRGTPAPSSIRPLVVGATQPEQPYPPGFEKGFKMPPGLGTTPVESFEAKPGDGLIKIMQRMYGETDQRAAWSHLPKFLENPKNSQTIIDWATEHHHPEVLEAVKKAKAPGFNPFSPEGMEVMKKLHYAVGQGAKFYK